MTPMRSARSSRIIADAARPRSLRPKSTPRTAPGVLDCASAPPPRITEYRRISKVRPCCGAETTPPGMSMIRSTGRLCAAGSPVRIGPETQARAVLLTLRALPADRPIPGPAGGIDRDRCLHRFSWCLNCQRVDLATSGGGPRLLGTSPPQPHSGSTGLLLSTLSSFRMQTATGRVRR